MFASLFSSPFLQLVATGLLAFIIMLVLGKPAIRFLQRLQIGQVIRESGPQSHYSKKGTPTMGGILIIIAITISSLCFGNLRSVWLWGGLASLWCFGAIGFWDDYKKLILKHSKGLAARYKYLWQSIFSLVFALWLYHSFSQIPFGFNIFIPFYGYLGLGIILFLLIYFTLAGSSNAVNLTDGLDGLAIICIMAVAMGLGFVAILVQMPGFNDIPAAQDIAVLAAAIFGAGLGFLWFNGFPALIFMGDVGALGLGALLGYMAICLQMELVLVLMGGIFVLETISVMLQVGSFKLRNKKRIFKMAPIHHHFELSGWPEPRVVIRFGIITVILVLIGIFSVLK